MEVEATGEPFKLVSPDLLESAVARPRNRWAYDGDEDVLRLAVSLMAGVAQNHPFQQGNKRTAFHAGILLLRANGWTLASGVDSEAFADAFVTLIEHRTTEEAFADRLRSHVAPLG